MKDLTTGNEAKLIFKFALPMLLGNVFQQLYSVIDGIIVGRYLGEKALAAVGASFPIIFTLIALIIGIGMGASVVISQNFGARNYDKVRQASDTLNIFLFISGLVLSVIGILSSKWIFRLMQLPPELMDEAVLYLNIYLSGLVFMFGFNGASAVLRGIGDSKTPLYFLIIATFTNIILVYLFVIVLNWGIAGAAWATVISQAGAYFTILIYLNRSNHLIRFNLKELTFNRPLFWQSIRIGLPTGLQQTFVALGAMFLIGIVNRFGTDVIAAYSAASRIDSMAMLPVMNFSAALSGFVGQNIGANKVDRVRAGLRATFAMSISICVTLSLVIVIWGDSIMALFTKSPEVIAIGHEYLIVVSAFYFLFAILFTFNGVLRGAGDTLIPMFITLFSLWVVRIPLAYVLSKYFGIDEVGIWWSIPIGWLFGSIGSFLYYKRGKWKTKNVIRSVIATESEEK